MSNEVNEIVTNDTKQVKATKGSVNNGSLVITKAEPLLKKHYKARRRINCPDSLIEDTISTLCKYVRLFNSLGEHEEWCLGTTLDNIKVPNELLPFLMPSSVRFVPSDRRTKDLLIRDKFKFPEASLDNFYDTISDFRRIEKKGSMEDLTSLDSIRKPSSYNDVLDRVFTVANGKNVKYDVNPFVPLLLTDDATSLFERTYFNTSFDIVLKHFIAMKG